MTKAILRAATVTAATLILGGCEAIARDWTEAMEMGRIRGCQYYAEKLVHRDADMREAVLEGRTVSALRRAVLQRSQAMAAKRCGKVARKEVCVQAGGNRRSRSYYVERDPKGRDAELAALILTEHVACHTEGGLLEAGMPRACDQARTIRAGIKRQREINVFFRSPEEIRILQGALVLAQTACDTERELVGGQSE